MRMSGFFYFEPQMNTDEFSHGLHGLHGFLFTRTENVVSLKERGPEAKQLCFQNRNVNPSIDAIKSILFKHKEFVLSVALSKTKTSVASVVKKSVLIRDNTI